VRRASRACFSREGLFDFQVKHRASRSPRVYSQLSRVSLAFNSANVRNSRTRTRVPARGSSEQRVLASSTHRRRIIIHLFATRVGERSRVSRVQAGRSSPYLGPVPLSLSLSLSLFSRVALGVFFAHGNPLPRGSSRRREASVPHARARATPVVLSPL